MMRIGIIGAGSIGTRRLRLLYDLGERDLHVFDPDIATQERLIRERRYHVWFTPNDFWARKPEAVLICTPPQHRRQYILDCVARNVPVFIEKPLGVDRADLQWHYCEHTQPPISMVACNWRFAVTHAKVKELLDAGEIGMPLLGDFYTGSYLPEWHPGEDYRQSYAAQTGATLDCGSHETDLALWLLGSAKLKAATVRPATSIGLDRDGMADMLLEHESGAVTVIHVSFVERTYRRNLLIIGTKGELEWDWDKQRVTVTKTRADVGDYGRSWHDWQYEGWMCHPDVMYKAEMQHFLECAKEGRQTDNPIGQAVKTLSILLDAKEGDGATAGLQAIPELSCCSDSAPAQPATGTLPAGADYRPVVQTT